MTQYLEQKGGYASNIIWTSADVDRLCGGDSNMPWTAARLTDDLKEAGAGDIYVVRPGFKVNQNILLKAQQKRVAVILTDDADVASSIVPICCVPNVYEALFTLASHALIRSGSTVVTLPQTMHYAAQSHVFEKAFVPLMQTHHVARTDDFGALLNIASQHAGCDVCIMPQNESLQSIFATRHIDVRSKGDDVALSIAGENYGAGFACGNDARIISYLSNGRTSYFNLSIGEQVHSASLAPIAETLLPYVAAAAFLAERFGYGAKKALTSFRAQDAQNHALYPNEVHVSPSVSIFTPAQNMQQEDIICRVKSVVDTGYGRRTVVLSMPDDLPLPRITADSNFICVRGGDEKSAAFHPDTMGEIVEEVLAPGDFVQLCRSKNSNAYTIKAYRAITPALRPRMVSERNEF